MDKKLLETTNLGVEITNSKRQIKRKLGHSGGTNSRLPFDVNVMFNLTIKGLVVETSYQMLQF